MDYDIYLIGLNHKTAGVEVREKFALTDCKHLEPGVVPVCDCINEALVLSTCNRVELLVVGEGDGIINHVLTCWAKVLLHTMRWRALPTPIAAR